jgi:hypothetical protein
MATRRSNGEGGLRWNEARQRWVGRASLGYNADGKRRIGTVSARTKTEARNKLRALLRDHDDGLPTQRAYTVGDAVEAWLVHGLVGRDPNTVANRTILARTHIIPGLGKRRLTELTAEEVDRWLADKASTLSTDAKHRHAAPSSLHPAAIDPSSAGARPCQAQCCVVVRPTDGPTWPAVQILDA